MEVGVLGATRIDRADEAVELPARKIRSILAGLVLDPGSTVSPDRLVDLVWGDQPPRGAHGTLHSYISGLRRVLEPELPPRARPRVLLTSDAGYRLDLRHEDVDATSFADRVARSHREMAALDGLFGTDKPVDWPDREQAFDWLETIETELRRWRGQAYADLGDHPDAVAARAALDGLRVTAEEDRALVMLALGDAAGAVAASEPATIQHPFRERTWAVHALALARAGRQADALAAIRRLREQLAEELGLDPGPLIRGLERAVLTQQDAILRTLPAGPPPAAAASRVESTPSPTHLLEPAATATWDTVGRARERQVLDAVLDGACAGRPSIAVLVGEPGVGKTRLTDDLTASARARGMVVATGSCSADGGAPPLWPWQSVLAVLGSVDLTELRARLTREDASDYAERSFAVSELLAHQVRDRAVEQPVLLVVDDLHWADAPTLRALTQLMATLHDGERVAVVVTRRPWPEPTEALADLLAEAARRGGRHLSLDGLSAADATALVRAVLGADATPTDQAATWWRATGGNAFFLVELARLAAERGGWNGEVPASVQAVVGQRLDRLPADTRAALVVAAALGHEFSPVLLAAVLGVDPWVSDELLDPARDAGIVADRDDGHLTFAHALTREAVLASLRPGQRSRTHARIAAAYADPATPVPAESRPFELARHWLAAGPVHAAQAWPAAVRAAGLASAGFAHDEAVELLRAALAAQRLDPACRPEQRFALLLELAEVAAYAGTWQHVTASAIEAIALAAAAGDPAGVAQAAVKLTRHSVWTPQEFGVVDADLVEDLRHSLDRVGGSDSADRVRLALALACQLYYAQDRAEEVQALVDQATAMADRIGDTELSRWTARSAAIAMWRSSTLDRRRRWVHSELEAARVLGDLDAEALAWTSAAGIALELADQEGFRAAMASASRLARRRRLGYLRIALGCVEASLAAVTDSPDLPSITAELIELSRQTSVINHDVFVSSLSFLTLLWNPEALSDHMAAMVAATGRSGGGMAVDAAVVGLIRAGRVEQVRELIARSPLPALVDTWGATWDAACRAETGYVLDEPDLAAQAAVVLRPTAGRFATAGVSIVAGPVDGYLALAEATLGHRSAAATAADRAVAQARSWDMSAYLRWLDGHRHRGGW